MICVILNILRFKSIKSNYMQKQKVFISVIVFNQNYVDAFLEYPFLTLKNNIEKISNYDVTIFVETQEEYDAWIKSKKTLSEKLLTQK